MAAALEREQIPQPSDAYVREQLARVGLVARIGTFSGLQGEDVRQFCDNVDGLQSRYGLGSWEMADIVIPQLRGDAATPHGWPASVVIVLSGLAGCGREGTVDVGKRMVILRIWLPVGVVGRYHR